MKYIKYMLLLCIASLPAVALGQYDPLPESPLTNSGPPTPVGSGARAMGTGGAFIAIADDATAASWNPGGLVQLLTPEMSMAFTNEVRSVAGDETTFSEVNYLSVVYPFSVGQVNMVSSLNYQRLYDFYYQGDFTTYRQESDRRAEIIFADPAIPVPYAGQRLDLSYDEIKTGTVNITGDVGSISPAFAVQVTPALSVGFTYNFWSDGILGQDYQYEYEHNRTGRILETDQLYYDNDHDCTCNGGLPCNTSVPNPPPQVIDDPSCLDEEIPGVPPTTGEFFYDSDVYTIEKIDFEGQNFNVGVLLQVSPRVTVGAVYRSEFTADLDRTSTTITDTAYTTAEFDDEMRFPASYGLGLAYRHSDNLTFAFDVSHIEWDRFSLKQEGQGRVSPINGLPMKRADIDPTTSYRAGMEYLLVGNKAVVPLRCGVFLDPEPARGDPDDYYGVSVGTGLVYREVIIDVSYWYRWGNDVLVSTDVIRDPYTLDIARIDEEKGDIIRRMLMVSAVVHME